MSAEFWTNAEKFYEFQLISIAGVLVIFVTLIIFVATGFEKKTRRNVIVGIMILSIGLIATAVNRHMQYRSYIDLVTYVNPLIRDRHPSYIGDVFYSRAEQSAYSRFNNLEALREFELYNEIVVTETVDYLGQDKYYHYFEHENDVVTKQRRNVSFEEDVTQTQFIGSQFYLKNQELQEIGFHNIERVMFNQVHIPAAEEGKTY